MGQSLSSDKIASLSALLDDSNKLDSILHRATLEGVSIDVSRALSQKTQKFTESGHSLDSISNDDISTWGFSPKSAKILLDLALSELQQSRPPSFRLGEKIGQGSFGSVHMGMDFDSGNLIAIKVIDIPSVEEFVSLKTEIDIMKNLRHINIVAYINSDIDSKNKKLYILQEWVPGGSISGLLDRFGPFPVAVVRQYSRQIIAGLCYLNENGIIHRDIKPSNILIHNDGTAKLADFGASKSVASDGTMTCVLNSFKGTPFFMAPVCHCHHHHHNQEVLSQSGYGRRADTWSVGCTVFQMIGGDPPWKCLNTPNLLVLHHIIAMSSGIPPFSQNSQDIVNFLRELHRRQDELFSNLSPSSPRPSSLAVNLPPIPDLVASDGGVIRLDFELTDFLTKCFEREPTNRPYASDLQHHPFLINVSSPSPVADSRSSAKKETTPHATVSPTNSPVKTVAVAAEKEAIERVVEPSVVNPFSGAARNRSKPLGRQQQQQKMVPPAKPVPVVEAASNDQDSDSQMWTCKGCQKQWSEDEGIVTGKKMACPFCATVRGSSEINR